jgi:hypothetical protein
MIDARVVARRRTTTSCHPERTREGSGLEVEAGFLAEYRSE